MKTAPEYFLARDLIAHLMGAEGWGCAVLPEPWHKEDQCQALRLAAEQYDMAVAVQPLPPVSLGEKTAVAGALQVQLGVSVFTTLQAQDPERQAAAAGRVIAAVIAWCPAAACGIPYAAAEILQVAPLDTGGCPGLANLLGTSILLGKDTNYKLYYKP